MIENYLEKFDLVDIRRLNHPTDKLFTRKRLNPDPVFVCLDYFLVPAVLSSFVISTEILPGYKTDHSIQYIKLAPDLSERGPGF